MTRAERVALHTNQKRMQLSGNMPNEKSLVEGKPQYRETFKGLYQYVKYNNEVYSQLLTKDTRTLQEEINDTVNNITVNEITISGTLDVSSGGTGLATIADGAVMLGSGTSAVTPLAVTTNGAILIGDGTTDPTTYNAFSSSTGTLNVGAGGTGQTTVTDFKNVLDDETWTFANNVTATGRAIVDDTTDATSKTDGSLQTDGGLSVAKAIYNGTAATLAADSGVVTIGSTTAATFSAAGLLNVNNATEATSTTDGSLQTDGGLSVVKDAIFGNDVKLLTDASVFSMGVGSDFTITHDGSTGATITSSGALIVDSTASTLTLDGHTGITLDASNSGNIEINVTAADDILIGNDAVAQDILLGNAAATQVDLTAILVDINGGSSGVTIDGGAASNFTTSAGAITIDSQASTVTVDGHTGVTVQSSNSGDILLDSVADVVLDAAGGNFEFKDATVGKLTIDVDGTAGDIDINLVADGDDLVFNQRDDSEVLRLTDGSLVVIRNSYITDHSINNKPASNGRHFATGDADYEQNYCWVGLYDQIAAASEHDADYGDWGE